LFLGVLIAVVAAEDSPEPSGSEQAAAAPDAQEAGERAKDLGPLMRRARSGDRDALTELRAALPTSSEPEAWRALGRGYARIQHFEASLKAYEASLALDPKGAEQPALRADVRAMAEEKHTFDKALALAEGSMGAHGVDLIYDVWLHLKNDKALQKIAEHARSRLDSEPVRAKASGALRAALALEKARSCADYKQVLGQYSAEVDERSASKLKRLSVRKGCGFLGLRDCWACLRRTADLSRASTNARRPAPSFSVVEAQPVPSSGAP
jgi:tetratricopeptide (TPR) repeat protein